MSAKMISTLYNGDYRYLMGEAPKDIKYKKSLSNCIKLQEI